MKYRGITVGYIAAEGALFLTFLTLDIKGGLSWIADPLKMAAISLVFLFAICRVFAGEKTTCSILLAAALFFTVTADIFLLFGGSVTAGVACFLAAQTLHMARIILLNTANEPAILKKDKARRGFLENDRNPAGIAQRSAIRLGLRLLIAGVIFAAVAVLTGDCGFDMFLILLYVVSFAGNIIMSVLLVIKQRRADKDARSMTGSRHGTGCKSAILLMIGLLLFFLCDINVALYNAASFAPGALPEGLLRVILAMRPVTGILMWTFYLPGQVLISLS